MMVDKRDGGIVLYQNAIYNNKFSQLLGFQLFEQFLSMAIKLPLKWKN